MQITLQMELFARKTYGFCFSFFETVDVVLGTDLPASKKYISTVSAKVCDACIDAYLLKKRKSTKKVQKKKPPPKKNTTIELPLKVGDDLSPTD